MKTKSEENSKLEQRAQQLETKCRALEESRQSSSAANLPTSSSAKRNIRRFSRDFAALQHCATSERPERIQGRNSVGFVVRAPYSNKSAFDVYKTAMRLPEEKKGYEQQSAKYLYIRLTPR